MKKKVTSEKQVQTFLSSVLNEVQERLVHDFNVAEEQMGSAELKLYDSLNEEQRKFFLEYSKKKNEFFSLASQIYKRKF